MHLFGKLSIKLIGFACVAVMAAGTVNAEETVPGYNTPIPEDIMTPDVVETRIGTLRFDDGRPTPETSALMWDTLDFMRGVEVFLNFIPATSIEGIRRGHVEMGIETSNQVMVFDKLMDSNPLFLTGNTDTIYGMTMLDLERDGATVIEIPKGQGPATVNDAYFRFVADMGVPGLDKGEGGKYLILPPEYEGELDPPEGGYEAQVDGETYFVSKSTSYVNWFIARGFLVDGKTDTAVAAYKTGLRIYPLAQKDNPPEMEFISGSEQVFNTIHANTFEFYHELDEVIQREPTSMLDPELRGLAASIGIEKGKPFAPDERMSEILREAVAVGNATARSIWLKPRDPDAYLYENSGWYTAFVGGSYQWLKNDGDGGRYADARTMFFYMATVNTPAMVLKIPGVGSQYALNATDSDGVFLNGSGNYKLEIPANVPAKDFWSVVVYDPQTRSELQTSQPYPSKNNKRDPIVENADGSVTLYFGPEAPEGQEANWVQTIPEKGWFVLLRLYGPLDEWFDRTWQPGEFERLE
ncbi:hypothetical protein shim_24120 [Shimia sp. SK013]|uniref:DUF1254 domain-containing protein n=1 Tax=Shimia sp. SK013 TaxID=1389006 RepID=UPI0006B579E6|nr:DUF1254 domain-containing protein [Shimia sp. SK013]KPA21705.1 hypothetical protein shim_24120 [Shimia sp. SK013]